MRQERKAGARLWRSLAGLAALMVALGGLAAHSGSVLADSTQSENIQQTATEIAGNALGAGAVSGPAVTFDSAVVNQVDVQVIAGNQQTEENSTQTSLNEANVSQDGTAAAGDTTSDGAGSTATSGSAVAGSMAMVQQLNVQVIAGPGTCTVNQEASNLANVDQDAIAASGDAQASGGGDASTGDASAINTASVRQHNVQVYVCRNDSTGEQIAQNAGDIIQSAAAGTGAATAEDGATASSGDTQVRNLERLRQRNIQVTID